MHRINTNLSFFVDLNLVYPPQELSSRIVGGKDADDGQAPFQCSLQLLGQHVCGCAVISKEFVITAGHCAIGVPILLRILVGTNDLKSGGQRYGVEKFIRHESYNTPKFANDIAVFRVKGSIEFNEKVQPIELLKDEVPDDAPLMLTGWGAMRVSKFAS